MYYSSPLQSSSSCYNGAFMHTDDAEVLVSEHELGLMACYWHKCVGQWRCCAKFGIALQSEFFGNNPCTQIKQATGLSTGVVTRVFPIVLGSNIAVGALIQPFSQLLFSALLQQHNS